MRPKQSRFRMPDAIATLILTRPRAASERFLEQLGDRVSSRIRVLISPLLDIVPTGAVPDLAGVGGVIFTSINGVAFAGSGGGIRAYCVGPATFAAARAEGWDARLSGATADELVGDLTARTPPAPLLHIGGVHRRGEIAGRLREAGIRTDEIDVYDQRRLPLSQDAAGALAGRLPVVVPLFSPRAAGQFASLAQASAPLHLVAISDAVMAQAQALRTASRQVVAEPDACAMCNAVAILLRRVEADRSPQ